MGRFVVRRILAAIALLFAISVVTFLIFEKIPNYDPAAALAGRQASPENIASVRKAYGFDQPFYVQYARTMKNIFTGQVVSYNNFENVDSQFAQRLPVTASLVIPAGILWLGLGILLGVISAVKAGRLADTGLTVLALIGISTPVFLIAAVFLYVLAFKLGWFPNTGYTNFADNPLEWAHSLVLPWIALSALFIGFYSRVLRSDVLDTVNQDFVRTARAKGLTGRRVMVRHVLRNSLIPVITLFGLDFAAAIGGGTILTETVFNLPGIGQYEAGAIQQLDITVVLVGVIFTAFFVVLFSAIVDVIYALLDPRVRLSA